MSAQARTIQEIAHDALEDLESAQVALRRIEAVLYAALADTSLSKHTYSLLDAAWNLAADGANTADCNREEINASRNASPSKGAQSPWVTHFDQMAQIVPLRKLARAIALSLQGGYETGDEGGHGETISCEPNLLPEP